MSRSPVLALVCLLLAGCSKPRESAVERLAVLPFENLTADPSLNWMGRAASEIVIAQISGSPGTHPLHIARLRDAAAMRATAILHGYITVVGGQLRLAAWLEDRGRTKIRETAVARGRFADGVQPLADSIARQMNQHARPFHIESSEALKSYIEALEATDPVIAAKAFERTVTASPNFGPAYLAWSQRLISRGNRPEAEQVIQMARLRRNQIGEIDRARLDLMAAHLEADLSSRTRALTTLAGLTPADAEVFTSLGETEIQAHNYAAAVEWYKKALRLEPSNPLLLNQLGYAYSYARDLEGASKALREYEKLLPSEANPLDSLGDVHFYLGRFADAEPFYLQAHQRDPSFLGGWSLFKAARARLMKGDLEGAEQLFQKLVALRRERGDALLDYRQAQWEYLTGRRRQAVAHLDQFTGKPAASGDLACYAHAQLSVWSLDMGNQTEARRQALQAIATATTPAARNLAAVCRFLTEGPAPASEWSAKAGRAFPDPSQSLVKRFALAYALLFSKQFAEASALLRELSAQTHPSSPDPVNVMLAWANMESGRFAEAQSLLETYPVPHPAGEQTFASLAFPRVFFLRAVLLDKQNRREEAKAGYRLFLKLSGDAPAVFGEEERARKALER